MTGNQILVLVVVFLILNVIVFAVVKNKTKKDEDTDFQAEEVSSEDPLDPEAELRMKARKRFLEPFKIRFGNLVTLSLDDRKLFFTMSDDVCNHIKELEKILVAQNAQMEKLVEIVLEQSKANAQGQYGSVQTRVKKSISKDEK